MTGPAAPIPLPRLLVLTDRMQAAAPLPEVIAAAVAAGARAVVLREKDLGPEARAELHDELTALLEPVGGVVIRAGTAGRPTGRSTGVHLAGADPFPCPRPALVGRSCHSAAELAGARAEGCDYVFLSPVFPTASKPGYGPALGMSGLARLAPGAPPIYALGGITPDTVADCVAAGARGVAVMGTVMRDPTVIADYLAALPPP